jgi:hypothetical protein
VVTRDITCHSKSVDRLGYNNGNDGKFTDEESIVRISNSIEHARLAGKRIVFVSYEGALIYRQSFWDWLFREIGVEPIMIKTDYIDGNCKYFT